MYLWLNHLLLLICLIHLTPYSALADAQYSLAQHYAPGDRFMQMRLSGTLRIPFQQIDGLKVTELSALAWDEDEQLLYAISDRSTLYHIQVTIEKQRLQKATVLHALKLRDAQGQALLGNQRDSEALLVRKADNGMRGDTALVVAFERQPRILRFYPARQLFRRATTAASLASYSTLSPSQQKPRGSHRTPATWLIGCA